MYTSVMITTTQEQNTIYWNWNWHVPRYKCLNCFKASNFRILILKIITVNRYYKQKLAAEYTRIYPTTQKQVWTSAMLKFNLHTKKQRRKVNKKCEIKPFPSPATAPKFGRKKTVHKKCMFWDQDLKCVYFGFLDTSVIA